MSNYEDYSSTAASYDQTRSACGYELILGMAAANGTGGCGVLLDAGCGTGNYSAALAPHFRHVEAVDMNQGMLAQARAKLATRTADGSVRLQQGLIDALPLAEASVDAAMLNQVLHHLPVDGDWSSWRRVFGELARVMRRGALLSINTCSHEQLQHGFWSYALIPAAVTEMQRRHVPLDALESLLREAGFEPAARVVPVSAVLQGEAYFDAHGPLHAAWREGDSIWALPAPAELAAAAERLRQLDAEGQLEAYLRRHDARRPAIGQITFLFAHKNR